MIPKNLTLVALMTYQELRDLNSTDYGWVALMSLWNAALELKVNTKNLVTLSLSTTDINQVLNVNNLIAENDITYHIGKDSGDHYYMLECRPKSTSIKGPLLKKEIDNIFLPIISFYNYKKQNR
jgi:hypothetical protein